MAPPGLTVSGRWTSIELSPTTTDLGLGSKLEKTSAALLAKVASQLATKMAS